MLPVNTQPLIKRMGYQVMDDYQEELLEARAVEADVSERDDDATEL